MTRLTHGGLARRRLGSCTLLAAILFALAAGNASAITRTRRVAGQSSDSKLAPVKPGAKPGAGKVPPSHAGKKAPAKAKPSAKGSLRHHREPEPIDDPIVMHRAKHSSPTRNHAQQQVAKAYAVDAPLKTSKSAAKLLPQKEKSVAIALRPEAPPTDHKIATVDDFVRAAGGRVAGDDVAAATPQVSEIYTTGESHPDDDERLPAHAVSAKSKPASPRSPQPVTAIAAVSVEAPPAPIERRSPRAESPQRIDGFGAEGDLLAKNPAPDTGRTPRVVKTKKFEDTVPVTNDPELAALARPSREELVEAAAQPQVLMKYGRNGRLIVPAPLKGSHEVLVHQNTMADDEGLDRIQDDEDLDRMRAKHLLVGFPDIDALRINPELPENRRAARPWTVKFAADMARAYYAKFHQPLTLSSAVRTVSYQLRLQRVNGNAAAVDGEGASPHLTGQAVDFGKHGMSIAQIAWMRSYLLPLMNSGKVDVEEEFQQACFHISVYKSYLPATKKKPLPRTEVAVVHAPRVDEAK